MNKKSILTVKQIIIRITIIISLIELVIMLGLAMIPHNFGGYMAALFDVAILIIMSSPIIYLWVIKPFVIARSEALLQLKTSNENLEKQVELRTHDLKIAKEEAEASNKAKSRFLENISHELRTPMHAILSYSEIGENKLESCSKEKLLNYFSNINQSGQRLLSLLDDLIDMSQLEAGKMKFNVENNDLGKVINLAVTRSETQLKEKELNLIINHPETETVGIFDADKILQVILKLLSNAIKFTPKGKSITLSYGTTHLSTYEDKLTTSSALIFIIANQGPAIPEKKRDKIFNKFVQLNTNKKEVAGTGLGLAICKEIITGHGGTISATNNPESDTEFKLTIPRQPSVLI